MIGKSLLIWALLLVVGLNGLSAQQFTTKEGQAIFLSKAPLSEFTGESSQLNGLVDLDNNLLDFFIDLNTLKTGIGLRDRHMRDNYLETKQFPFAEFTGKMESLPQVKVGVKQPVVAEGIFKLHGQQKEIVVNGTLTWVSVDQVTLEASFAILLGDFKIDVPSVVFYELAEEQKVTIRANLKK